MVEVKPCPFCGSENAAPYSVKSCHSVLCVACGGEGPEAESEEGAIAAWSRRTSTGVREVEAPSSVPLPEPPSFRVEWGGRVVAWGDALEYGKACFEAGRAAGVSVGDGETFPPPHAASHVMPPKGDSSGERKENSNGL